MFLRKESHIIYKEKYSMCAQRVMMQNDDDQNETLNHNLQRDVLSSKRSQ